MMSLTSITRAVIGMALAGTALSLAPPALAKGGVPEAVRAATRARFDQAHAAIYAGEADAPPIAQPPAAMFRKLDINRDGKPDWLVDHARASHLVGGLCGTGGCLQQLYVARADGTYALVFAAQALGLKVGKRGMSMPLVTVQVHGIYCGGTGSDDCRIAMQWSEPAQALVPVGSRAGAAEIHGFNPLADAPPPLPAVVAAKLAEDRATCAAAGMELPDADLADLAYSFADINGDGMPDWIAAPYCSAAERAERAEGDAAMPDPPQLESVLFVSRGPDFARAWSGKGSLAVSLSGVRPALLVSPQDEACPEEGASRCNAARLVWDDAAAKLVPAPQ